MLESKFIGKIECFVMDSSITTQLADTMLVPVPQDHSGLGGIFVAAREAGAIGGCEALDNFHKRSKPMELNHTLLAPSGGGYTRYLNHVASVCEPETGKNHNFLAVVLSVRSVLESMNNHNKPIKKAMEKLKQSALSEPEKQKQLKELKKEMILSVNIPLMGTGQMGWLTTRQSAGAMLIGVKRFADAHPDADLHINFCIPNSEQAKQLNSVLNTPELYTNISDDAIFNEKGDALPSIQKLDLYCTDDPLSLRLSRAIERTQRTAPSRPGQ